MPQGNLLHNIFRCRNFQVNSDVCNCSCINSMFYDSSNISHAPLMNQFNGCWNINEWVRIVADIVEYPLVRVWRRPIKCWTCVIKICTIHRRWIELLVSGATFSQQKYHMHKRYLLAYVSVSSVSKLVLAKQ